MKYDMLIKREGEIAEAVRKYPNLEIGEAYRRWKEERGEKFTYLSTSDKELQEEKKNIHDLMQKPCQQPECNGIMKLEAVCASCVEGRKGYRSKWTCEECLHRELSTKTIQEWIEEFRKNAAS